jgi:hypothetical protein
MWSAWRVFEVRGVRSYLLVLKKSKVHFRISKSAHNEKRPTRAWKGAILIGVHELCCLCKRSAVVSGVVPVGSVSWMLFPGGRSSKLRDKTGSFGRLHTLGINPHDKSMIVHLYSYSSPFSDALQNPTKSSKRRLLYEYEGVSKIFRTGAAINTAVVVARSTGRW